MKTKRWVSVMLCMLLCVCMLPMTAFAAENYGFRVYDSENGTAVEVSNENSADVLGDGTISYDAATNTLTLNNATLTSPEAPTPGALVDSAIDVYTRGQSLNIELIGENTISGDRCIFVSGSLEISGSGSLNATGTAYGVYAGGNLTIDGVSITSNTDGTGSGISAQGTLAIKNSKNVTGTAADAMGIYGGDDIIIEKSTVTGISTSSMAFAGISTQGGISITNSTVTANSANDAAISANDDLIITDSTVNAQTDFPGGEDDYGPYGIFAIGGYTVTISGGSVTATATGDYSNAIFADSTIEIMDGAVVKAKATSDTSSTAIYGFESVSVSDSNVTAQADGSVAVYSPYDITIENSIVDASAPSGWNGIRGDGGSSVSGSWISTTGNENFGNNITDSVLINGNSGRVIGSHTLLGDTMIPSETTMEFTEGSGLTVPAGITLTNNGVITGDINITNNGTIICNNHAGGTATCTEQAVCAICNQEYGDLLAHDLTLTEKVEATCTTDGKEAYYTCENCGKHFSDAAGQNEIPNLNEYGIIPATAHEAGTEWKSDETSHWKECLNCGDKLNEADHEFTWVTDKEATATEAGSKHEECTVCGYKKASVEIPVISTYPPEVEKPEGGNVEVTPKDPQEGDKVTITPKPEDGYEIGKVVVKDEDGNEIPVTKNDDGTYTFIQPGSKVTITVDFAKKTEAGTEDETGGSDSPQTGDNSNMTLWIALLLVSATALTGTAVYSKRKKKYSR